VDGLIKTVIMQEWTTTTPFFEIWTSSRRHHPPAELGAALK